MLIFFQQLCLLLFLWLLKLVDGLMEIFSAISGITDVTYKGEKVNIIEFLAGDSILKSSHLNSMKRQMSGRAERQIGKHRYRGKRKN